MQKKELKTDKKIVKTQKSHSSSLNEIMIVIKNIQ
jgi:hypothetical protein